MIDLRLAGLWQIARDALGSRSGKGLAAATVLQLSNYAIPLLTFPYLARVLGVEGFGLLGLAAAVMAYALLITDWGFGYTGTQSIAINRSDPPAIRLILWDVILGKAGLACLCAAVVVAGIPFAPATLRPVLLAAMLNLVASVFTVDWVLRGLERFADVTRISILSRLAAVPLVYILVRDAGDVALAAAVTAVGSLLSVVLGWVALGRAGFIGRPVLRPWNAWAAIKDATHLFSSVAATSLYTHSIAVILGIMSGSVQVGLYSGASRIKTPVNGLLSPISMVFFPRMSAETAADPAKAEWLAKRLLLVQGSFALVLSIALTITAPLLIRILLGAEFADAVPVLRVQAWLVFVVGLGNAAGIMIMIPFGMKRELGYCVFVGAAVGLATVFPLAHFHGALGASVAALLAESAVTGSMLFALTRRFHWMRFWSAGRE